MSGVQSVERAFSVLQCLAGGPAGVTEIADRVSLPKSTVSRLLSTLQELGAVEQVSAGGLYRVGSSILHLASGATPLAGLVDVARPHVRELAAHTGEAAGLAVLEGRTVRYLDSAESVHAVQVRDWTGELVPLHVVPSGLVLLAHAGEAAIDAYLAVPLERFTEHTVADPVELRVRLSEIRGRHHEWVIEEFAEGISSVAAPVRNRAGVVVAAVHAHGPAYRFPPDDVTRVEELVVRCAARVSARLAEPDRRTPGDR